MTTREGPSTTTTIRRTCEGCRYHESEYYCIEDGNDVDSGFNNYCTHALVQIGGKTRRSINDEWNTPRWCPFLAETPMKRHLIITIDAEEMTCGECHERWRSLADEADIVERAWCRTFDDATLTPISTDPMPDTYRLPACLEAEQSAKRGAEAAVRAENLEALLKLARAMSAYYGMQADQLERERDEARTALGNAQVLLDAAERDAAVGRCFAGVSAEDCRQVVGQRSAKRIRDALEALAELRRKEGDVA